MEKVYKVTFMEYTDSTQAVVSYNPCTETTTVSITGPTEYLTIGKGPFLIRESELTKYIKFGKGFKELIFVGYMN